jgi:uncharacterized protein (DUF983 family)
MTHIADILPEMRAAKPPRPAWQAISDGALGRCPSCRTGRMFDRYLKVAPECGHCGEELHHQRADDAPPYFVISIVGHLVIGLILWAEMNYAPPMWVHGAIWIPMTLALSLLMLPPVKGALVGLQWALYMHGFDPAEREDEPAARSV